MKRHGNLFSEIITLPNFWLGYQKARKGKRWQKAVKEFEANAVANVLSVRNTVFNGQFSTSPYRNKTIYEPKQRQIYILPFAPDRIAQHSLMNIIEPIWEGLFIHDSYACRVGKGIHAGSRRTMEFLRKNKYCLQCDIAKFYPSIKHNILFDIIQQKIKCRDTLALIHDIIYSIDGGQNVPIGSYTSQWFGNLYMNELDHYLKHTHKIRNYIRYCDDFLLFHSDKSYLHDVADALEDFIDSHLGLRLKKRTIFPVTQGVDFLGYRHFRDYILLRKSTAKRVQKRLKKLPHMLEAGQLTREQFRSSLASTMGWMKWANTYNLSLSLELERLWGPCNVS